MNMSFVSKSRVVFAVACCFFWTPVVSAVQPTPQQIEQFKRLSPSQQKAMAQQFGIKLPSRVISSTPVGERNTQEDIFPTDSRGGDYAEQNFKPEPIDERRDALARQRYDDLRPFGYRLFSSEPTTFAPAGAIPAPEKYVIGPGDRFQVFLFGKESADYSVIVGRDGTLVIPDLDRFSVQGMTFESVQELVQARVKERKIGVSATVPWRSLGQFRYLCWAMSNSRVLLRLAHFRRSLTPYLWLVESPRTGHYGISS